jgi:hypothetical protein
MQRKLVASKMIVESNFCYDLASIQVCLFNCVNNFG